MSDTIYLVCSDCHRKSWGSREGGGCGMRQPDGSRCAGIFRDPTAHPMSERDSVASGVSASTAPALGRIETTTPEASVAERKRIFCDATTGPTDRGVFKCFRQPGHSGEHRSSGASWPNEVESKGANVNGDLYLLAFGIVQRFEAAPFRSWHPVSRALYELAKAVLEATADA